MAISESVQREWARAPWPLRTPTNVVIRTFRLYFQDQCGTYAAAIAYYAIFSLIPLSLIILSIFGLVVDEDRIVKFVFEEIPLRESDAVRENVREIVQRARDISIAGVGVGVLVLIWSSSGIFTAVRRGLNAASHRKKARPYWHGKLIDIALIPCFGLLIIASVGLTTLAQIVIRGAGDLGPVNTAEALQVSSIFLAAASSFALFLLLYRYVPSARPGWLEAFSGALFATILFETAKNVYALAFSYTPFSRDTAIYAGFGSALAFLLWMFVNASILLLGAEFGRALRGQIGRTDPATSEFVKPFR